MTSRCVRSSVGARFDSVERCIFVLFFLGGGGWGGGGGGGRCRHYGKEVGEMLRTI